MGTKMTKEEALIRIDAIEAYKLNIIKRLEGLKYSNTKVKQSWRDKGEFKTYNLALDVAIEYIKRK